MNYNPSVQYGYGATGGVPGALTAPNPSADLSASIPNLGALNSSIFGNLLSESQGQIPQADQNFMQDQAAGNAIASGMPGSNVRPGTLMGNKSARDLGLMQYQLQQNAMQQYPSLTGAVKSTQTLSPELQLQVAGTNALNAAAPNPGAAQSYAQQLYNQYLQSARGPGGGTAIRGGGAGGGGGPAGGTMTASTGTDWGMGMGYGAGSEGGATLGQNLTPPQDSPEAAYLPAGGGYQPTSGGTMYMGDVGGYDPTDFNSVWDY